MTTARRHAGALIIATLFAAAWSGAEAGEVAWTAADESTRCGSFLDLEVCRAEASADLSGAKLAVDVRVEAPGGGHAPWWGEGEAWSRLTYLDAVEERVRVRYRVAVTLTDIVADVSTRPHRPASLAVALNASHTACHDCFGSHKVFLVHPFQPSASAPRTIELVADVWNRAGEKIPAGDVTVVVHLRAQVPLNHGETPGIGSALVAAQILAGPLSVS